MRPLVHTAIVAALMTFTGCSAVVYNSLGRVYYADGAGNWGWGHNIQQGLQDAGFQGDFHTYSWSISFNPAIDQTFGRISAHAAAKRMANDISAFREKSKATVTVMGFSAGTGVAVWACENAKGIENLILIQSSLSADYPLETALKHVRNHVIITCSSRDEILKAPVYGLGTIDGKIGVKSLGLVGVHNPRITVVQWNHKMTEWSGSHTDATNRMFIKKVIAPLILNSGKG